MVRVLVRRAPAAGTSTSACPTDQLRLRAHDADELSHYSSGTSDVEFLFPWGWDELEGIANRGDYDLTQHAKHSGEKLDYFDQATNERYVPHVIEPAAGATRDDDGVPPGGLRRGGGRGETRTVLRLHHRLAPVQGRRAAAVEEGRAHADGPRGAAACSSRTVHVRLRRDPGHRPALPPPGRDRHAATASPSTSTRSTTARSPCASATRWPRTGSRSTTWWLAVHGELSSGFRATEWTDEGLRRRSGGREHALAWACRAAGAEVVVTPGNPGIPGSTKVRPEDIVADLFVIGPERPLVAGLADRLRGQGSAGPRPRGRRRPPRGL